MPNAIDRTRTRAAIANSLERAESLSITPALMERYIDRQDPQAYLIVESWEPRRSYARYIVLMEPEHA